VLCAYYFNKFANTLFTVSFRDLDKVVPFAIQRSMNLIFATVRTAYQLTNSFTLGNFLKTDFDLSFALFFASYLLTH